MIQNNPPLPSQGRSSGIEQLPRIHDPVRVQHAANAAHDLDLRLAARRRQVSLLHQPDAVLGGDAAAVALQRFGQQIRDRSEEHKSELQSLMRISYDVFGWQKKNRTSRYKRLRRNK